MKEEELGDIWYWSLSLIWAKEGWEEWESSNPPCKSSGFLFCNLPVLPRTHRRRFCALTFGSFSPNFHCGGINCPSLRGSEKIPEVWGGLESTQRDFQFWGSGLLYMSTESSRVSWTLLELRGDWEVSLLCAFPFSQRKQLLESQQNKLFSGSLRQVIQAFWVLSLSWEKWLLLSCI